MIYEYVKNEHGHRKGIVCATSKFGIGWSLCHNNDIFDKNLALKIAEGRARKLEKLSEEEEEVTIKIPESITNIFDKMVDRADRYYKN
jgi:hypothetical protein